MWWKKALTFLGGAVVGSYCMYNYMYRLISKVALEEKKPKARKRTEYAKHFEEKTEN
jgi:hypothetical protein